MNFNMRDVRRIDALERRIVMLEDRRSRRLTGNRRYRKAGGYHDGVSRNIPVTVVLQVEFCEFVMTFEGKPGRWVCEWRDATTDDLTALEGGFYG